MSIKEQLQEALQLGEREGYQTLFAEIEDSCVLLREFAERIAKGYMPELYNGISRDYLQGILVYTGARAVRHTALEAEQLLYVNALTPRELEILTL
ncbi:hypothetical protein [Gorillibacterium massiliense]|uniref:hypothetical protein n=1 Tax=Gorillibacterium massiliense TaxID=1280390 RepID=UPI0004B28F5C|nr:hypothetical protein [Gorillibacterium massiliense]